MPKYLMTVCYEGTNYHGWQVQDNAVTVQPTIQDALKAVIGTRPNITGCSRTDSGVHALEYCFHFEYNGNIGCESLVNALNVKLPSDIAAISCIPVDDDFHARYSVKSKQYIYRIYNGKYRNPFYNGYAHFVKIPLDEKLMDKAAKAFIGTHDYSGFCSSGSSVEDTVRTVYRADVKRADELITFEVEANGFLYNMVRIMAGTLLYVSYGKIKPEEMPEIIKSKDRSRAGVTAPAHGLYLNKVNYAEESLDK